MSYLKLPLKTVGFSLLFVVSFNVSAANNSNSIELNRKLTVGVNPQVTLQEGFDGFYKPDGTASIISEPNYQSDNLILSGEEETDKKTLFNIAKDYLTQNANKFGLSKNSIDSLAVTSIRIGNEFSVIRLEQRVNGLSVYGSSIAITILKNSEVSFVAANTVTGIVNDKNTFSSDFISISKQQAISITSSYLGFSDLKLSNADLVFFKDSNGNQYQVWKLRIVPKSGLASDWEILLDSSSGKILRAEDKLKHVTGSGMVYKPDPVTSTHHIYGDKGFVDNTDSPTATSTTQQSKDSPVLTAARIKVNLKEVTLSNGKYILESAYARCNDFESPKDDACPAQLNTEFNFTRTSKYFDAVNAFYSIDSYLRYD